MKRRSITSLQIIYLLFVGLTLASLTYTQSRGIRLLSVFAYGLSTHTGPSPVHK
jgi:hypothetical protein